MMESNAKEKLCLALDNLGTVKAIEQRVEELAPYVGYFKIGLGSFSLHGPDIVKRVQERGGKVFLDLKFHDIPNTVKEASHWASELGVDIFNVHTSGGIEMMKAAVAGAALSGRDVKIIGVTILTSIDETILSKELRVESRLENHVLHLAKLAKTSGLSGIVCSAQDLSKITSELPDDFFYITPGIKGVSTLAGQDQKRVMTPGKAVENGSSLLVVGRAINGQGTKEERISAATEILKDMSTHV